MTEARALAAEFERLFGAAPAISRAPGRVNLIGEHTDYNDGFVMPAALEYATFVAAAPRSDRTLRVYSAHAGETLSFDLDAALRASRRDWSDYVFGVAGELEGHGRRLKGADLMIASDVPIGAGLSSSAALEVSVAHALLGVAGLPFEPIEVAKICQRAENEFVGMRCGIMDQYISCCGRAGHALLIDCRSLKSRPVKVDAGAKIIVANSMVHHVLAGGGEYNARRQACEEGVRLLRPALGPIRALRDVTREALEAHRGLLPDLVYRRCRHVVTENARVLDAERAFAAGDLARAGALMSASHVSMRDDFEISCAEVDTLVAIAQALPGVYGSRMTGGGFGGCTVSLVAAETAEAIAAEMARAYRAATGLEAVIFSCAPAAGAGPVSI